MLGMCLFLFLLLLSATGPRPEHRAALSGNPGKADSQNVNREETEGRWTLRKEAQRNAREFQREMNGVIELAWAKR